MEHVIESVSVRGFGWHSPEQCGLTPSAWPLPVLEREANQNRETRRPRGCNLMGVRMMTRM